jgi:hypothetical protein
MVRIVECREPPPGAMGLVVWPSDILPTYQITAVKDYKSERARKPGLSTADLEVAVARAKAMLEDAPPDYAVFVVVE